MLNTRVCKLLNIQHPVILGGMASATSPELVAAVSNTGGLGIQGSSFRSPDQIAQLNREIRALTDRPFGLNLLLFGSNEAVITAVLAARPAVFSTAWSFPEQDLRPLFARAHEVGAKVAHMVSTVPEAVRAAEAGADLILAQGSEGGGHVGVMGTMPLVLQVVRAVAPLPVVAAGGIADGAGLAAALMMGAEGVLLGTRFLATPEAPLPETFKQALIESDGHDTLLTEIPDIVNGRVWPGAYARVARNRLIEDWVGREGELRYRRAEVAARIREARAAGDTSYSILYIGQTAGLINTIEPAAAVVERIVQEATDILRQRVPALLNSYE